MKDKVFLAYLYLGLDFLYIESKKPQKFLKKFKAFESDAQSFYVTNSFEKLKKVI